MTRPYAAAPAIPSASTSQQRTADGTVTTHMTHEYLDEDAMAIEPPPAGYAHLMLQPVTRKTVVTTTTVTTLQYPPIRVPQVEAPHVLTDSERARLPLSSRIAPTLASYHPTDDRLDPKLFPLARAQLPESLSDFRFAMGGAQALFIETSKAASADKLDKGKGRAIESESTSPRIRRQPPLAVHADDHRPSPRKRAKADHAPVITPTIPSSPPASPRPGAIGYAPASPVSDHDMAPTDGETVDAMLPSLGAGNDVAALLSLPSLVNDFASLAPNVQAYVLFNLLRRSSVPVLQRVSAVIEPALKRDFLVDLPPELVTSVLCGLDGPALIRASCVSRAWRQQVNGDGRAWLAAINAEGLYIGDGAEARDAARLAGKTAPTADEIFFKTWGSGIWKADFDQELAAMPTEAKIVLANNLPRKSRPSHHATASSGGPLSPVSFSSPFNPRSAHVRQAVHPYKMLYRERFMRRRRWMTVQPTQTTFANQNPSTVTCLSFDRKRIISASDDQAINVYQMPNGRLLKKLEGHEGGVWALQYLGNILVSGSTDRTVRIWDLDTFKNTHCFVGHTSTVRCLQILEPINVNPDPHGPPVWEPPYPLIVTGSRDCTLRTWRLPSPKRDSEYKPFVPLSPSDGDAHFDTSANPFHLKLFTGHRQAVRALAAHGRTVVSGSYDFTCRVWDALSGECSHVLEGHTGKVYSVVLDPAHQRCASGSMDGSVRLWSTATGDCLRQLDGHTSLVGLLGLSGDRLISAAADATLRLWTPGTGECTAVLSAHTGAITCFQHDQHKVISGSDGTLKLWNVNTGHFVRDLLDNLSGVWQCAFDERYCIAAVQRNGRSEFDILDFGDPEPESPYISKGKRRRISAEAAGSAGATIKEEAGDDGPASSSPIMPIGDPNIPFEPEDEEYESRVPEFYDDPVYQASPLARVHARNRTSRGPDDELPAIGSNTADNTMVPAGPSATGMPRARSIVDVDAESSSLSDIGGDRSEFATDREDSVDAAFSGP